MKKAAALCAAALAAGLAMTSTAYATEGSDQYPMGAENWGSALVPPPGPYLVNYMLYYGAALKDGGGNTVPDSHLSVLVDAPRFIYVMPQRLLGAAWAMHFILPIERQQLKLAGASGTQTGIGNATFDPIILAWNVGSFHPTVGLDIDMPTGTYHKGDVWTTLSPGRYWTFEPIVDMTYLSDSGWEVTTKFMYDFNTADHDYAGPAGVGRYKSGQDWHVDYLVGKHFGPWAVGVAGYYYRQVQNDRINGDVVAALPGLWSTGRRGRELAYGPTVSYTTPSHMEFVLNWQHESYVQNRFSGNRFWFKIITRL
ncbi:MAG TPA: transporter [Nevskiaceae bacterium]|nr:transporter [Nevskiaceae bacterium]